jgi:hypothetical protein
VDALIAGYENDPLVDGTPFLDDPLFWPTYLASTAAAYDDTMVIREFNAERDEVVSCYRRVADKTRWPVFRMALPDGHEINVVYRNLDGDMGVDIVLCRAGGTHPLTLTRLEAHYCGPGLSWCELIDAARFSATDGVAEQDTRLLLLLPALGDADLPDHARSTVSTALAHRGARSDGVALAESLLMEAHLWPRWRRRDDGARVCDGRYSKRNPGARGAFASHDQLEVTSAFGRR